MRNYCIVMRVRILLLYPTSLINWCHSSANGGIAYVWCAHRGVWDGATDVGRGAEAAGEPWSWLVRLQGWADSKVCICIHFASWKSYCVHGFVVCCWTEPTEYVCMYCGVQAGWTSSTRGRKGDLGSSILARRLAIDQASGQWKGALIRRLNHFITKSLAVALEDRLNY
jgi:hypothetical protein